MDLRAYGLTDQQLEQGIELIRRLLLRYQPFILADSLEVGEGQNLHDGYGNVETVFDFNVYGDRSLDLGLGRLAADLIHFRRCNAEFRQYYQVVENNIVEHFKDEISELSFGEIGCNTGLHLFNLARLGAKECVGFDWNDVSPVFTWLNDILGTNIKFHVGYWDSLSHDFVGAQVSEVDVMITSVFLNHQSDPLQHLAFMCDRSRKAVFLWVLAPGDADGITADDVYAVRYPAKPNTLLGEKPFPLCFNDDVSMTEPLIMASLRHLGFEKIEKVNVPCPGPGWESFTAGFRMYLAERTNDRKSAFWKDDSRQVDHMRKLPRMLLRRLGAHLRIKK